MRKDKIVNFAQCFNYVNISKTMRYPSLILVMAAMSAMFTSCGFKKEKSTVLPPIKVEVIAAAGGTQSGTRLYTGTVESTDGAEMSFTVAGTLNGIYVSPGQKVSKGQLLAEIDDATLENACQMAEATLAQAQDAYARLKKLHDANALPDMQWVDVQNKLRQAENAAAIARRAVGDASIYAPVSGIVAEKLAEAGQTVAPGVPVVRIVSIGDVKVNISVPEAEIGAMTPGTKAAVTAQSVEAGTLEGVLTEQGVVANPLSRTYDVKFKVSNASGALRPGMLCNVIVDAQGADGEKEIGIVIPANAVLLSADNRHFVWLAKDGKAEQRFVETGTLLAKGLEITDGIVAGDSVIVAGLQKVCNGTKIQY